MSIRVFIYEDNASRSSSLKNLVEFTPGLEYAGSAINCENVLQDMEKTYPDVVLMDIQMPVVDGLEGLRLIKQSFSEIKILMQTIFEDNDKIFTSIRNGASGYILKKESAQNIVKAIIDVHNGGGVINPVIAKKVIDFFQPREDECNLSKREAEVLALLAEGLSYKMVADKLNITFNTVNTHTKKIYEKLHVASLGEAIAYYYSNINRY